MLKCGACSLNYHVECSGSRCDCDVCAAYDRLLEAEH